MIAFKSLDDLSKLPSDDPAYPIVEDLANRLLVTDDPVSRPYDPEADGWIVLIEENDVDRPLTEIWGDDAYSLIEVPWEGFSHHQDQFHSRHQSGFYIGVFLANNDFGLLFVIPDEDWLPDELVTVLEDNLVPVADDHPG